MDLSCFDMASQGLMDTSLGDNMSPQIIIACTICSVFAGFAVVARLTARRITKLRLLVSDYLVVVGLVAAWVLSAMIMYGKLMGASAVDFTVER